MKNLIVFLKNQKTFSLKSQGSSMMPILQPNDVIYYQKTSFVRCQLNDIIMVKKNRQLFSHRVIYKTKKYLITKGDNNLQSDGKIYSHQVMAKVCQIKRNGKIFHPESLYLLQSSLYFKEIIKIKTAFEMWRLNFVFLKGLPLHLYYEKTHPQRIYLDCDVLIDKKDFKRAEDILIKCGYKKSNASFSKIQRRLKDKETEGAYFKIINGFPVVFDLHLETAFMMTQLGKLEALYPQKLINHLTEEFLKTKKVVTINGEKFPILNSQFLILYLALHFFHHNFRGAFRMEFLDKVIRKCHPERSEGSPTNVGFSNKLRDSSPPAQNDKLFFNVAQTVKKYHLQNFVYPTFILLKKYYQTPLPKNFLHQIEPSNFKTFKLLNLNKINIFDDEPRIKAGINRFKNLFFLSPNPLWKKVLVFLNPQVAYSIFWTFQRRLSSSLPIQKPAR